MTQLRYQIIITFKDNTWTRNPIADINESVKTLKDAIEYKELVDDSVLSARLIDNVTGKVIEVWK